MVLVHACIIYYSGVDGKSEYTIVDVANKPRGLERVGKREKERKRGRML